MWVWSNFFVCNHVMPPQPVSSSYAHEKSFQCLNLAVHPLTSWPAFLHIKLMNTSTASLLVQPTDVDKKKKDSKYFLGGINPHKIIDEEDFEI